MGKIRYVRLLVSATLLAAGLFAAMALPGLLSDRESTTPVRQVLEAGQ